MASFIPLPSGQTKAIVRSVKFGITASGQPRSRSKVFDKKGDARTWATAIEGQLTSSPRSHYHRLKQASIGGVLGEFMERGAGKMLKQSGIEVTTIRLRQILREEPALCAMDLTDPQAVADALRDYRDKCLRSKREGGYGLAPATATRNLATMSTAFKWAIEVERLPIMNPVKGLSKPNGRGNKREFIWTDEFLATFLEVAQFDQDKKPETLKDLFPWTMLLARVTGFRRGDILSIQKQTPEQAARRTEPEWKGYIDLSVPEIFFPGTVADEESVRGGRKADGGVGWHAPLTDDAVTIIEKLLRWSPIDKHPDLGFPPDKFIPMSQNTHGLYLQRLKAAVAKKHPEHKAILERPQYVTFHGLRHTFTTDLVAAYMDPASGEVGEATKMMLKAMTGRKTMASLEEYFHPDTGALAKGMNKKMPSLGVLQRKPHLKVVNS